MRRDASLMVSVSPLGRLIVSINSIVILFPVFYFIKPRWRANNAFQGRSRSRMDGMRRGNRSRSFRAKKSAPEKQNGNSIFILDLQRQSSYKADHVFVFRNNGFMSTG
jgi:hypothetical protein